MNAPNSRTPRLAVAIIAAVVMLLAFAAMAFVLDAQPRAALAAAPQAPAFGIAAAPLQQTVINTDTFDSLANPPSYNDNASVATQLSLSFCSSPAPNPNLTLYRANATPPAADRDYYRVTATALRFVTVTVSVDGASNDLGAIVQLLDTSQQVVDTKTARTGAPVTLSAFNLNAGSTFYISVSSDDVNRANTQAKPYTLLVCQGDTNVTATPLPTVTPTFTPTPAGNNPDNREPNDTPSIAAGLNRTNTFINIGQQLTSLNFYTITDGIRERGDVDWFWFYSQGAKKLRIYTTVNPGVDTELFVYDSRNLPDDSPNPQMVNLSTRGLIAGNDDYEVLNRGSQIIFDTSYEGVYWVKVWNKDQSPRVAGQTYNLTVVEIAPGTPSPTPAATPYPAGADKYEYNGDFNSATLIAPGVKVDGLNFVPFQPGSNDVGDRDFFRLPVKQGIYYTCETLDLSAGTDTNMIVYSAPDFNAGLGGSDDLSIEETQRGNFRSRFSWLATYTGFSYILIGQPEANQPRPNEATSRTYSLLCSVGLPAVPTPTVNPNPPTATPPPPPPTPVVPPTPEPTARTPINLVVQPIDSSSAPPTVAPTATPRILVIEVQTFIDLNNNGQLDPGSKEGISGTSVRLYDAQTSTPLGQAFTDGDGKVRFSINNEGPVQVSVPVFGYLTTVSDSPATIRIGLPPFVSLPDRLP